MERAPSVSIYFENDNHNYEVKRLNDNAIVAQTAGRGLTANGKTMPIWHWEKLSKSILENEKDLRKKY